HRWNKSQQDALLPYVESGEITLIGATTENPSFSIISPLLSRARVFIFEQHSKENILAVLERALQNLNISAEAKAMELLAEAGNGDIRFALNALELAAQLLESSIQGQQTGGKIGKAKSGKMASRPKLTLDIAKSAVQKYLRYDKTGEEHYNLISAVHKS